MTEVVSPHFRSQGLFRTPTVNTSTPPTQPLPSANPAFPKPLLLGQALPYASAAAELGLSEGALRVAVHRLRKRYRELFREEIAHTVAGPEEIEAELRHLLAALSG